MNKIDVISIYRILELKNEMVLLEFSEYHYLDDVLSDLKLTPVSSSEDFSMAEMFVSGVLCKFNPFPSYLNKDKLICKTIAS